MQCVLDDAAGSPRIRLPFGPLTIAGEVSLDVRIGRRPISGSPWRLKVRPGGESEAAACTLHPRSEPPPPRVEPVVDDEAGEGAAPSSPAASFVAGKEATLLLTARDEFGNRRYEGGDKFYALVRPKSYDSEDDPSAVAAGGAACRAGSSAQPATAS